MNKIIDEDGNRLNLEQYYKEQVIDFGSFLYNMAKDGIPPATSAVKPSVPNVNAADFQVLQINKHITDVSRIDKIKKLQYCTFSRMLVCLLQQPQCLPALQNLQYLFLPD